MTVLAPLPASVSTTLHDQRAADLMTADVVTLRPTDHMRTAMQTLSGRNISSAPVVEGTGRLVGLVSEHDCLAALLSSMHHRRPMPLVRDAMSRSLHTTSPRATLLHLAHRFVHEGLRRLPVVDDDGRLIGLVSRHDLVRAAAADPTTGSTGADPLFLSAVDAVPPISTA